MKVLLLKDVYKLGRAGDVKKVANGFGRNYLMPQGLAVLATPGAMKNADRIRAAANVQRTALNQELGGVADRIEGQMLSFPVRASETGKLYGSVTSRQIADAINEKFAASVTHRQIDAQPLRNLGDYKIKVRLTIDLAPTLRVVVYREGESVEATLAALAEQAAARAAAEAVAAQEAKLARLAAEASAAKEETPVEEAEEAASGSD